MNKEKLRERIRNIQVDNKSKKDALINEFLISHNAYRNAKTVYLFMPAFNEPDISPVFTHALDSGKDVYVPITRDVIRFAKVDKNTEFGIHKYGMREPIYPIYSNSTPDIVIVPMLAFDKNKSRLGHGKGYYDRFLVSVNTVKIGVSYSDFLVDNVYAMTHDITMDNIITDNGILV